MTMSHKKIFLQCQGINWMVITHIHKDSSRKTLDSCKIEQDSRDCLIMSYEIKRRVASNPSSFFFALDQY